MAEFSSKGKKTKGGASRSTDNQDGVQEIRSSGDSCLISNSKTGKFHTLVTPKGLKNLDGKYRVREDSSIACVVPSMAAQTGRSESDTKKILEQRLAKAPKGKGIVVDVDKTHSVASATSATYPKGEKDPTSAKSRAPIKRAEEKPAKLNAIESRGARSEPVASQPVANPEKQSIFSIASTALADVADRGANVVKSGADLISRRFSDDYKRMSGYLDPVHITVSGETLYSMARQYRDQLLQGVRAGVERGDPRSQQDLAYYSKISNLSPHALVALVNDYRKERGDFAGKGFASVSIDRGNGGIKLLQVDEPIDFSKVFSESRVARVMDSLTGSGWQRSEIYLGGAGGGTANGRTDGQAQMVVVAPNFRDSVWQSLPVIASVLRKEHGRGEQYTLHKITWLAQVQGESSFDPNAIGGAGEVGLIQIKPSTARDMIKKYKIEKLPNEIVRLSKEKFNIPISDRISTSVNDLKNPAVNLYLGALYLAECIEPSLKKNGRNFKVLIDKPSSEALMRYNQGIYGINRELSGEVRAGGKVAKGRRYTNGIAYAADRLSPIYSGTT